MALAYPKVVTASVLLAVAGLFIGANVIAEPPTEKSKKAPAGHGSESATPTVPPADDHKPVAAAKRTPDEIIQGNATKQQSDNVSVPSAVGADQSEKSKSKPGGAARSKPDKNAGDEVAEVNPDKALQLLQEGNDRWVSEQASAPNTGTERRLDVAANGQKPFATVLTCADSRIPVERVFDRGVGDVFVIRVAGNVVGGDSTGTIEYGAEHLHVPLLVVMGHTKCGAVAAAASEGHTTGSITQLVEKIAPAVARTKQQHPELDGKELAAASVKENVWQSVFDLVRTSASVRGLIRENKLRVVGAVYDVATGKVEWIGEHPWQQALVDAFDAKDNKATQTAGAEKTTEH